MLKLKHSAHAPTCRIPSSSVADIAFLLVVFFALIANEPDRTRVTLPESKIQAASEEDSAIVVVAYEGIEANLNRPVYKFSDGVTQSITVDDPAAIQSEAAQLLTLFPERQFRIKADERTPCRIIGNVLDALTGAGGREVVMVTAPRAEEAS